ncbi:Dihydrouridine synthase [Komagataella phaffii CBS 7435]|uniref:tRNA-dihydrouridine(16/17) synthase [NAD(P)(+)] n=2 Tax=Komagataella phaffii TaxID=460519 RepID=C4QZ75_KOMPG|nr:tRNA-dihydrouridine synthase 1 [Komagataella phaffii GS115]AOA61090.1 GQ67_01445T0 [Komagataella phaffii]CAH2447378.1 Dihydrouridine synthase [Komagataella phaffii CBS 7435]AOA66741.1 GQ68_01461T0 [Komagataella phaffii GS115]CAY68549.1 tRNA-dihydrouridine synthase 1 [Komagataella phaffii GS115]CCA37611.1 Dihydrouridine synthase [Komagataella phaffii CBS 7435]
MTVLSKLSGRALYEAIGKPKTIVAPMVDQSELAWRILSRRYGADLCYTPMFHAKLFATQEKYRKDMMSELDGDEKVDRPLIVQFCANDPEYLLQAARLVADKCDAVDLNLGCPQGIAKKGNYGSFLMDDWKLVHRLIKHLHENLSIPVTAKIRVYDDKEKSLEYAKMVLDAGAQFLTIHGRTREMKGQQTGLANWETLKYIRDNLPDDTVFFANGNILYSDDLGRCLEKVNADAVMSAEGNLFNPGVFWTATEDKEKQFPRLDRIVREYFEVLKTTPGYASRKALKSHLFRLLRTFLPIHTDVRAEIAAIHKGTTLDEIEEKVVRKIESIVESIFGQEDIEELDSIKDGPIEFWGGSYKEVPYWRCQPYFRPVDGISGKEVVKKLSEKKRPQAETPSEEVLKKRKQE